MVAEVNANRPGWTAALLDNTRRAAMLGGIGTMAATTAKGVTVTVVATLDIHADAWQTFHTTVLNGVFCNNSFYNVGGLQVFFLNTQDATNYIGDSVWANNWIDQNAADPELVNVQSQLANRFSGVDIVHNTMPRQTFNVVINASSANIMDSTRIHGNVCLAYEEAIVTAVTVTYNQALRTTATWPARAGVSDNQVSATVLQDEIPSAAVSDIYADKRLSLSRRGARR